MLVIYLIHALSVGRMDEELFDELVEKNSDKIPYFIMFTNPDCHKCQESLPIFEDAEYHTYDVAEFYVVDAIENPNLTSKFQLTHFPTFALFFRNAAVPFLGKPQIHSISNFLVEQISMRMLPVNESWYDNHRKKVIYFAKRNIPPTSMGAAFGHFYRYDIDFGMRGDDTIVKLFNVSTPQWFFDDGIKNMTVPSIRHIDDLFKHIRDFFNITEETKKHHHDHDHHHHHHFNYDDL